MSIGREGEQYASLSQPIPAKDPADSIILAS